MRRLLRALLIAAALLAAGCIEALPGAREEPADPAAASGDEDPAPATPAEPTDPAPEPADAPKEPAPPADDTANATAPADDPPADDPPAAPAPAPWALAAEVPLGFAQGAAAPGQAPVVAEADAEHCPDAAFVLPGGTATLVLTLAGEAATGAPSAGHVAVDVLGPDGSLVATLDPLAARLPAESGAQGATTATLEAPPAGAWTLQARPVGPVVAHAWTLALSAEGEAVAAPASLDAATTCG